MLVMFLVLGLQWFTRSTHGGALRACGERASRVRERASRAGKASKTSNFSAAAAGRRKETTNGPCLPARLSQPHTHMGSMCGQLIIAARDLVDCATVPVTACEGCDAQRDCFVTGYSRGREGVIQSNW